MTPDERIERRLPQLFDELAAARVPDYFDSMLQQTARTRQRPAWSSLERWLPMGVIARPVPFGLRSWRPVILALIALAVALAASALLLAGSRPHLPPPFGPARNGLVLFSTTAGDIEAVDPVTGSVSPVLAGSTMDTLPGVSPDGRRFAFIRTTGSTDALFVANIDGSGAHVIPVSTSRDDWVDWSPDSSKVVVTPASGATPSLVDATTGKATPLPISFKTNELLWLPQDDQLLGVETTATGVTYHVVASSGSDVRSFNAPGAVDGSTNLMPGGNLVAYHSWQDGDGLQGRIHILNLATGENRLLTSNLKDGFIWENPVFSPDGTLMLVLRFVPRTTQLQAAVLRVDGTGAPVLLGSVMENGPNGAGTSFSPDGTEALVNFSSDGSVWLFPVTGAAGHRVNWTGNNDFAWQRAAW